MSQATNSYSKTHPLMAKASKKLGMVKEYCHAEALALIRSRGKGEKLIVVRIDSEDRACYSAPCLVCADLIKNSHIKYVEFSV